MRRTALVFACLTATPALADSPSFDCGKAESEAEILVCGDPDLAALDRATAAAYAQALDVARSLDTGTAEAEATLRATQRGWIGGRDDCWKAEDPAACVENAYLRREAELITQWRLIGPSNTVFWACDGAPANEVVTSFFDTTLPSVLFERGDSIDTGILTRTATGARYDGSFGRYIWIKGNEATYRDADPDGQEMTCVISAER